MYDSKRNAVSVILLLTLIAGVAGAVALTSIRQTTYRGTLDGLPDAALSPRENILGVNVDLRIYDEDEQQEVLTEITETGFIWIRQTIDWADIEPEQGQYDWATFDNITKAIDQSGLRLTLVLNGSPSWAAPSPGLPPYESSDFGRFSQDVAIRYKDSIDAYQIWDEPNLAAAWDGEAADPVAYAELLEAAYTMIHAVDQEAFVLAAGLAPTIETGPENLNDILFLDELYKNDADSFFDAAAGKPYGFDTGPEDRSVNENRLNFSRLILLREVMESHNDYTKPVWASHFGWNSLPEDWEGDFSLWGQTDPLTQAENTINAYYRALEEWPWAGVFFLENWQPAGDENDARWGFALRDQKGLLNHTATAIREESDKVNTVLWPGIHSVTNPSLDYSEGWKFSELGADFAENGGSVVEVPFRGDSLGIIARRGNYRAHLIITIDGEPSTTLPINSDGDSYLILTDPDYQPRIEMLPIAETDPSSSHTANIEAIRGWDQWALVGFGVGHSVDSRLVDFGIVSLIFLAIISGFFLFRLNKNRPTPSSLTKIKKFLKEKVSHVVHLILSFIVSLALWLGASLTWGGLIPDFIRRIGDGPSLLITALTAGIFYFSPWLILTLVALVLLFLLLYARPSTGIPLLLFFTPYVFFPRPLFDRAFSMVEIISLMLFVIWITQNLGNKKEVGWPSLPKLWENVTSLDKAVIFFVLISIIAISWADLRGVAITDIRQMVAEPAFIYLILRTTPISKKERWQIVDMLILTGLIVSFIGFYQAITGIDLITAEGGSHRLKSVFGTPNNAALFLERLIPIGAAVAAIEGASKLRRWFYGFSALLMVGAAILTMSKGSILLGLPTGLGLVLVMWLGRTGLYILGGGIVLLVFSLIPLSRIPRFASLFDFTEGSSFFRLQLWNSTVQLIKDHPFTGVGPDQFLYAYRGHYIQPEAWQQPDLSQPHNFLLNYWVRLGIFGLSAGIWLQTAFWTNSSRLVRAMKKLRLNENHALVVGFMGSVAAMVAHGMVDETHFVIDLAFIFFAILGLIAGFVEETPDVRDNNQ